MNDYRLREAKKLLFQSPPCSVKEAMYSAGFSSKSTFNPLFKKFTGLTPVEYQRQEQVLG